MFLNSVYIGLSAVTHYTVHIHTGYALIHSIVYASYLIKYKWWPCYHHLWVQSQTHSIHFLVLCIHISESHHLASTIKDDATLQHHRFLTLHHLCSCEIIWKSPVYYFVQPCNKIRLQLTTNCLCLFVTCETSNLLKLRILSWDKQCF